MRIRAIFFLIIIFLFSFSFSSSLFAAELAHPPVVSTITGPTSGLVGQTYTFDTSVTSVNEYSIDVVTLYSFRNTRSTLGNISPGSGGCITTGCALSSTFTPSEAGTYTIYVGVDYYDSVTPMVCRSGVVSDLYDTCQSSSDKYITFVASDPQDTPLVVSITGPTSGVVGQTYSFTSVMTSVLGHDIIFSFINQTNNLVSDSADRIEIIQGTAGSTANCEVSDCTLTGSFTPTAPGTYIIYSTATYDYDEVYADSCTTYPYTSNISPVCANSSGRYITFVVTGGTDPGEGDVTDQGGTDDTGLPSTGLITNQMRNTYIGIAFIALGILTTQTTNIYNSINKRRIEKSKSKLENSIK